MLLLLVPTSCYAQSNRATFEANQRLGRGVNLGNFLEAPRDADWGADIRAEHFALIRQAGFNSVRLPVRWPDYAAKSSPFAIEPAFFKRVDRLLAAAEAQDLNVVMNIHHFEGLDSDPDAYSLKFKSLWEQIATRYKDRGKFLYFELNNEPHSKLNERWNDILRIGLAAVRKTNPTRPVIVGPPHWNGIWALPKLKLPDDPNLIVTVHMYNPHEFTHQGASWANPEVQALKNLKWGTADEVRKLEQELAEAAQWGKDNGRPLFLGEFGAYQAAPMASRVKWTDTVVRAAEQHKMSWAYWEFCAGFGIYDVDTKKWNDPLVQALGLR